MLQDKSQVTVSNAREGDIQAFFVLNLGEVIGTVKKVTDSEIILSDIMRVIFQEDRVGFQPIGQIAALNKHVDQRNSDVSIMRSSIVYTIKIAQNLEDAYKNEISGIQIARGNVESNIEKPS